ncbi:unnamed protein product, partial [Polarella glacialis]
VSASAPSHLQNRLPSSVPETEEDVLTAFQRGHCGAKVFHLVPSSHPEFAKGGNYLRWNDGLLVLNAVRRRVAAGDPIAPEWNSVLQLAPDEEAYSRIAEQTVLAGQARIAEDHPALASSERNYEAIEDFKPSHDAFADERCGGVYSNFYKVRWKVQRGDFWLQEEAENGDRWDAQCTWEP